MFDRLRTRILHVLRVPPAPQAPGGAPGSKRIFRAGKNFYKLHLLIWAGGQLLTLVGILFSVGLLLRLEYDLAEERSLQSQSTSSAPTSANPNAPQPKSDREERSQKAPFTERDLARLAAQAPPWVLPLVTVLKVIGILAYILQIPVTYCAVRLNYEQRWYIVTDRSLRIRSGLVKLQEATMSFANVQNVTLSQNPLQRLLGIADVRVQSAGGGGGESTKDRSDAMHVGIFHGVDNAEEIRDLIAERLRIFREAGLGDPDDARESTSGLQTDRKATAQSDALVAIRELLQEARALRDPSRLTVRS